MAPRTRFVWPFTFRGTSHAIRKTATPIALVDTHPLFFQHTVSAFHPFTLSPHLVFVVVIRSSWVVIFVRVPEGNSGSIFLPGYCQHEPSADRKHSTHLLAFL